MTIRERLTIWLCGIAMFVMAVSSVLGVNEQGAGRSYFNINQASINEVGSGYNSTGTGEAFNKDGTGFFRVEVPVGVIVESVYTDDGIFYRLDWSGGGGGGGGSVVVDEPLTGDGSIGDPIGLVIGDGLDVVGGALVTTGNIIEVSYAGSPYGSLNGVIDGVNRVFDTSVSFIDASLVVYLNGVAQSVCPTCNVEIIDSDTFRFNSDVTPQVNDTVMAVFTKDMTP